jgi:hypothetical protein
MKKITQTLIKESDGRYFITSRQGEKIIKVQDHSACVLPGLLALSAQDENDSKTIGLAAKLMESCWLMYEQKYGLAPAAVGTDGKPYGFEKQWQQGPETMESLFVLWRITKNPKYRRWGYQIAQSIEKHAKVATGGYAGIENVNGQPLRQTDRQDSYFLSKTIKYLYLLCGPSNYLPLDEWVFSAEGHPFPINWRGVAYSKGIVSPSEK